MTAKFRLEHAQRGYDWHDMVEETEGLTAQDLLWARYPSDDELAEVGVRGIYLANYVNWEPNSADRAHEAVWLRGVDPEPFERTYRRMSNLDDMHENGIHDYLKFVKFGYGRGTDHACKDIRAGKMTRARGSRWSAATTPSSREGPGAVARIRRHGRGRVRPRRRHVPRSARLGRGTSPGNGSRTTSGTSKLAAPRRPASRPDAGTRHDRGPASRERDPPGRADGRAGPALRQGRRLAARAPRPLRRDAVPGVRRRYARNRRGGSTSSTYAALSARARPST